MKLRIFQMWSNMWSKAILDQSRGEVKKKKCWCRNGFSGWLISWVQTVLQLPKQARYTRLLSWIIRLGVFFQQKPYPEEWYLEMTIFCDWVNTIQTALRPFHCPTWIILNQCVGDVKRKRENKPPGCGRTSGIEIRVFRRNTEVILCQHMGSSWGGAGETKCHVLQRRSPVILFCARTK